MEFLVGFPTVVGEFSLCFVGGEVFITCIAVFIIILCRCASWLMRSDEGSFVIFALRSDYSLPNLADRLLELANLSEKAIESLHFL